MSDEEDRQVLLHMLTEFNVLLGKIDSLEVPEQMQFLRVMSAVGSCFTNKTNHGMFLLVENEEMLKCFGVNATSMEAAHIVTQAAGMFLDNEIAKELHRQGETH